MKKLITSIISIMMMFTCLIGNGVSVYAASEAHTCDTTDGNKVSGATALTSLGGNLAEGTYYLNSDITATNNITISNTTVSICLNGHTINLNEKHFSVTGSATLNLYDCSGDNSGKIIGGNANTGNGGNGGAISIINGPGNVNLYKINISDSQADQSGGAIYIGFNGATVNMYGGSIKNCHANDGGGVYVYRGTFNMYNGLINNCTAIGFGGGVQASTDFHMYGGTISNCSAKRGGGVSAESLGGGACVHMHGGNIINNTATVEGGGIYNELANSSFDGLCIVKDNTSGAVGSKVTDNAYCGKSFKLTETNSNQGLLAGSYVGVNRGDDNGIVSIDSVFEDGSIASSSLQYFHADRDDKCVNIDPDVYGIKMIYLTAGHAIEKVTPTNGTFTIKNGTIEVSSAQQNKTITISPTANDGYEIDKVYLKTKSASDYEEITENSGYTFTMPDEAVSIKVTFSSSSATVTFDSKGGSTVASSSVDKNTKVTKPTDPTKSGYTFGGWYKDTSLNTKWDFDANVTEDITLYAKWNKVEVVSESSATATTTTTTTPTSTPTSTSTSTTTTPTTVTSAYKAPNTGVDDSTNAYMLVLGASCVLLGITLLTRIKED